MERKVSQSIKILIADDEPNVRRILEARLAMQGHIVVTATNGVEALDSFHRIEPELDGFAVTEQIRAQSDVPIILLTALGDVADRITGLQLGADDYIMKPFSPKELEARIRCVMRRSELSKESQTSPGGQNGRLLIGDLMIDFNRRQAFKDDIRIRLTGMEF